MIANDLTPSDFKPLITQAHGHIASYIRKTPTISLAKGTFGIPAHLTLKLELLQHSGSFKARGALSRLLQNTVPSVGAIAASGGNHGAAVAYAARELGYPAEIFVPTISSPTKVKRLETYGAKVVVTGADYFDALEESEERALETGGLVVHAFNQPEIIAGQGTLALELEQQVPELDTVLVSVGGGGLIAGISAWYQNRCRVIGTEPTLAPSLHDSLAAGKRVDVAVGGITSDALGCRRVGEMMFPIAQQYVEQVVLVDDDAIAHAQKLLWEDLRIAAEPAGVVPLAALLSGRYKPADGERIGVIICGGNTNLSTLCS
ncbi:MAG: threonine/serine dehydratase [Cyanobacteria bacterium J06598_1]